MTKIKTISLESKANFFWFLVAVSFISLFVYVYAINALARNTAVRQNLEAHMADIGGKIGGLEFAHIELKNAVTQELAYEYGFREVRSPLYVSRTSSSGLTYNR
jgi:hypothetical protein